MIAHVLKFAAWLQGRSGKWPAVRAAHLKTQPYCAACGERKSLEVHHIVPFSWDKSLELVENNLVTLCESPGRNCHLWVGHLGDFKSRNPDVTTDAAYLLKKIKNRPYPAAVPGQTGEEET